MRIVSFGILMVAGTALLLGLGIWQVQRLAWKEGILAEIAGRIGNAPVALPGAPGEAADEYLAVAVRGAFEEAAIDVLVSIQGQGPGFRAVTAFATEDGRRILVDRGFVPEAQKDAPRSAGAEVRVEGNLLWPDEVDGFTPAPDLARNIWFARDLPAMAAALGTEPVLVVARQTSETDPPATPMPVDTSGIRNDHLEYAVTWFGLAAVWIAMSAAFLVKLMRGARSKEA